MLSERVMEERKVSRGEAEIIILLELESEIENAEVLLLRELKRRLWTKGLYQKVLFFYTDN